MPARWGFTSKKPGNHTTYDHSSFSPSAPDLFIGEKMHCNSTAVVQCVAIWYAIQSIFESFCGA